MKFLVSLVLILSSSAFAKHHENTKVTDCRVTRMVDYTYFEEGLSTYEYPEVNVRVSRNGEYTVSIGGHQPYELTEGDQVSIKTQKPVKTSVHILKNEGDQVLLEIEWRTSIAKLVIRVKEEGSPRFKTIAYGMCNKGVF